MRHPLNRPTDVELSILRALWGLGPATVRQVHEVLTSDRDLAYTAVLKMMQTMVDKGLLLRDESGRSHIYRPSQAREHTLKHLVDDLLERAFGGSALDLLATTLSSRKLGSSEREEIAQLLAKAKEKRP
ncbi:BlaI/MecI/CopY family transcriptional regulator [Geothrix sp.]|jgi:predicted transcriptional regulator|uniref:BlaI/MecI/CopY family transcriptional regulator n=1 Tax=Geothrix sp. TaxID=1962974 RepID=UPI0025B97ABE|nr:BlaI/MecI/CopY family transcriptional regulator [Geothrix sp.]